LLDQQGKLMLDGMISGHIKPADINEASHG
jgi:hypothetical protein